MSGDISLAFSIAFNLLLRSKVSSSIIPFKELSVIISSLEFFSPYNWDDCDSVNDFL